MKNRNAMLSSNISWYIIIHKKFCNVKNDSHSNNNPKNIYPIDFCISLGENILEIFVRRLKMYATKQVAYKTINNDKRDLLNNKDPRTPQGVYS